MDLIPPVDTGFWYSQVHDVVHDGPGLHVGALYLDEVVVDGVEQQGQGLYYHQHTHQVVDLEHRLPANNVPFIYTIYIFFFFFFYSIFF